MTTTYSILSTYPPTQCGLATFTSALAGSMRGPDDIVQIVAVSDVPMEPAAAGGPVHVWVSGEPDGAAAAAAHLNRSDIAIIQHEYGIFGGADGEDVLELLPLVTVPIVVVLHTVLTTPTARQRSILNALVLRADVVVTMTHTARERLLQTYVVQPELVHVVPHGAADPRLGGVPSVAHQEDAAAGAADVTNDPAEAGRRPTVLTWGLLGVGKGIEWGIDAMAELRDLTPAPRYLVVGETHPKVLEHEGERYRRGLEDRVVDRGVEDLVEFDARYLTTEQLQGIVAQADVVLLPYDSREQVTSGVLVEAVTARRPVIATGFPHARELLSSGAGFIVERQDARGIADAVRLILTEPARAAAMTAEANRIAPHLLWTSVGEQYRQLAAAALATGEDRLSA